MAFSSYQWVVDGLFLWWGGEIGADDVAALLSFAYLDFVFKTTQLGWPRYWMTEAIPTRVCLVV